MPVVQILQNMQIHSGHNPVNRQAATANMPVQELRSEQAPLGKAIAADGGLAFMRKYIEDKLAALFEAATELDPTVGAAALFDTSTDVSPQATGQRIASFALAFFQTYKAQNSDLSGDDLVMSFRNEIQTGIENGFAHAEQVLSALELLDGEIKTNAAATYEVVMAELESAFAELMSENGN